MSGPREWVKKWIRRRNSAAVTPEDGDGPPPDRLDLLPEED